MAVRFDLYLEPHPWLSAAREILLSAMSSMEAVNRRVAAEALSQLCVVVDIEFVREVINAIQDTLTSHTDERKVSAGVFCLCAIQRSVDARNGEALSNNIIRVLISECTYFTQPIRTWCLHSVSLYLQYNDVIRDPQIIRWVLITVNHNMLCDAGGRVIIT